ncbi:MAG: FAD-dependent oxidoreductase, partial [Bryocella sp.]
MEFDRKEQIFVVGAGVIGCSLSLELADRGWQVTLVERDTALRGSSWAAAGMLAVEDPHNPVELLELSRYSRGQYDRFLGRIEALGRVSVRYQTERVRQYLPGGGSELLVEHSLNPRELAAAVRAAVVNSSVELLEGAAGFSVPEQAATVITAGSWSGSLAPLRVRPAKGQMLRVTVPAGAITEAHRSAGIYVVPRMHGEQAGTALVGATIEDVGFDTTVQEEDLVRVRERAAGLAP